MKRIPIPLLLLAAACGSDPAPTPVGLVAQVWRDFDATYPSFALRGVDWNAAGDQARSRAVVAQDDLDVANAIGAMLLQLRDVHVVLQAGNQLFHYTTCPRPARYDDAAVTRAVQDRASTAGGHLQLGHAAADTGYVRIQSFGGSGWGGEIDEALSRLSGIRALVVDVRSNGGGSDANSMPIAQRFLAGTVVFSTIRRRSGPGHDDLGPPVDRVLSPAGPHFAGPVAVLIDGLTASAAESFAMMMRAAGGHLVGEASCGASAAPAQRSLPRAGWSYLVPTWLEYVPWTGRTLEIEGIPPDVQVSESAAGNDPVLEAGLVDLAAR
jgi:hypothetical protein